MEPYKPSLIEKKAQDFWLKNKSFITNIDDETKPKFYCLTMFPYPSGSLHMGHVRTYVIGDVLNRYKKMSNFNVLHPMGWDAFGLPAENAALLNKTSPREWTYQNISLMKKQLIALGCGYDWNREISTCEPEYYKHQQWFFIQLFNRNLAYKKKSLVYWDPVDKTVLANEQVIDGCGWRSGAPVELREIDQWFFRVTSYSEDLYNNLDNMSNWPHSLREIQKNWIGKSSGTVIKFFLEKQLSSFDTIEVFTTLPSTILGVSYIALSTKHPLACYLATYDTQINNFIEKYSAIRKECQDFIIHGYNTGIHVLHPITGQLLPVWLSNYVHEEYATGCIMGVPSQDLNDRLFADKYGLHLDATLLETYSLQYPEDPILYLQKKNVIEEKTFYRLRDWGVSRQRYWGCPIPIIYCKKCGIVAESLDNLPVILPQKEDTDQSYLVNCPICGDVSEREKDTFDTFVESSWYYARYICPHADQMLDLEVKNWLPVDQYIGGMEHATLHFLYARFFYRLMNELGLVIGTEPFDKVMNQGLILKDGLKMSKSKGNIVNPQEVIEKYGADVLRLFIINAAPVDKNLEWDSAAIVGSERFLKKLWSYAHKVIDFNKSSESILNHDLPTSYETYNNQEFLDELERALKDMHKMKFNTVVSSCMKMLEILRKGDILFAKTGLHILLRLLHPFAPHITHYLWQTLNIGHDILLTQFPTPIQTQTSAHHFTLVVQHNGKKIGTVSIPVNLSQELIEAQVLTSSIAIKTLANKTLLKIIYVEKKLINLITSMKHKE